MSLLLENLMPLGCAPVEQVDADLRTVERDRCAPEDFYSTTNHRTFVRHGRRSGSRWKNSAWTRSWC